MDKIGEYTLNVMKKATWYNTWLLSFFKDYLSGNILEVGAGIGNFTDLLSSFGKVTAIDINEDYIKNIGRKYDFGYGNIEKGEYYFKNKKFNSIVCLNVIEHIKNDSKAIKNIYQLLEKNGYAVALVPAGDVLFSNYDKSLGHFRRYTTKSFEVKFHKSGFKIVKVRYLNWWGAIGWLVFLKVLRFSTFPKNEVGIFDILGKYFLWPEKFLHLPFGLSVLIIAKK